MAKTSVNQIGIITGGCNATTATALTTDNALRFPIVQVDAANRIAILDLENNIVHTYNQPSGSALGRPLFDTPLTIPNSSFVSAFVFLGSGTSLYTAENARGNFDFAKEYDYRSGGAPESSITVTTSGILTGIAVTPPLVPR